MIKNHLRQTASCQWSLTAQPPNHACSPSVYLSLSEQNKFIDGFPWMNTIEKKVWNLNSHGTSNVSALWEFVRKYEPPQEMEAVSFQSMPFPCPIPQEKSVFISHLIYNRRHPIPSPNVKIQV